MEASIVSKQHLYTKFINSGTALGITKQVKVLSYTSMNLCKNKFVELERTCRSDMHQYITKQNDNKNTELTTKQSIEHTVT